MKKLPHEKYKYSFLKDPIYGSYYLNKFINCFVRNGQKEKVYKVFLSVFGHELHKNYAASFIFFESLEKFKPILKIVCYRYGRDVYKLPAPILDSQRYSYAIHYYYKFVISADFEKKFHYKLRNQLLFIFFTERLKVPELENIKKLSVDNRMFVHYR